MRASNARRQSEAYCVSKNKPIDYQELLGQTDRKRLTRHTVYHIREQMTAAPALGARPAGRSGKFEAQLPARRHFLSCHGLGAARPAHQ